MVTNAKESYEAKILEKLIDNSEKLAVIRAKMTSVEESLNKLNTQVESLDIEVKASNSLIPEFRKELSEFRKDINRINSKQNWFFTILAGIGTGILATLYSQPILTALSNLKY